MKSEFVVRQEKRPCMIRMADKTEKKALWHMFSYKAMFRVRDAILQGQTGGQIGYAYPVAVVEYEDGSVHEVGATEIRFLDSDHDEYMWEQ